MHVFRTPLLALLTLLGGLTSPARADGQRAAHLASAPLVVTLPTGASVPLNTLSGHPQMLHFFNGPCRHCRSDDLLLKNLALNYTDQGVVLLNISRQPALDPETVASGIVSLQVPVLVDRAGTLARRYGLRQHSGTVFLDRRGRVVARWPGGLTAQQALGSLRRVLGSP